MTPKQHLAFMRKLLKAYKVPNNHKAVKELLASVSPKTST